MKKTKNLLLALLTVAAHGLWAQEFVMLTIHGDPSSTAAVTWRTAFDDNNSIGQIIADTAAPDFIKNVKTVEGSNSPWDSASDLFMGHKVQFSNLSPATAYLYRVGNGKQWSEWFRFSTAANKISKTEFLYIGDFQNDAKEFGSRLVRQATMHFPKSQFLLWAGDIVSSCIEPEWAEVFAAGSFIFGSIPSYPVPGNHEYSLKDAGGKTLFCTQWDQIFQLPNNGPKGYNNRQYYVDYQGIRFVFIDSTPLSSKDKEEVNKAYSWIEETFNSCPSKWIIATLHHPVYTGNIGREASKERQRIKLLFEKYKVDLVLQGHDHIYSRGQYLSGLEKESKHAPMYITSVSGPKMYGLNPSFVWGDRIGSNIQLYQHIVIDDNQLHFKAFEATGVLYDAFTITKSAQGNKINIDPAVDKIPQKTVINDKQKSKYTAEDLELYKKRFGE